MTIKQSAFFTALTILLLIGFSMLIKASGWKDRDDRNADVAKRTRDYCAGVRAAFELDARDLADDRKRGAAIDRLDGQHAQRSDLEVHLCTGGWPPAGRDTCWIRRDAKCLALIATEAARSIQ